LSLTSALLLGHLGSTAMLLAVLWLVIGVQTLSSLVARLHGRWGVRRRATAAAPVASAAVARFCGMERRRPAHSSS